MAETSRRTFLKQTMFGSAVLAGASLLPASCSGYDQPDGELKVFNAREYNVLRAIADTFVPAGGPIAESASEMGIAENLDAYMAGESPKVVKDFRSAINLFEYGPMIFDLKFSRFTRLSPEERAVHLESWQNSSIGIRRTIYQALKKAVLFAYYSNPKAWKAIGYGGPMI